MPARVTLETNNKKKQKLSRTESDDEEKQKQKKGARCTKFQNKKQFLIRNNMYKRESVKK